MVTPSSRGEEVSCTSQWESDKILNSVWDWICCCSHFWKMQSDICSFVTPVLHLKTTPPSQGLVHGTMLVSMYDFYLDALSWKDEVPSLGPFLPLPECESHSPEMPGEASCGQEAHRCTRVQWFQVQWYPEQMVSEQQALQERS